MDHSQIGTPIEVLLVEDDLGDVQLTREVLKESEVRSNLHVVSDAEEARTFLRMESVYADIPCPHLILLDLNLPNKDSFELLAEIKAEENLRPIPVVVVITSRPEEDMSYTLDFDDYIIKPIDLDRFMAVVKRWTASD